MSSLKKLKKTLTKKATKFRSGEEIFGTWWNIDLHRADRAKTWELYDLLLKDPQAFWEYVKKSPLWQDPNADIEYITEMVTHSMGRMGRGTINPAYCVLQMHVALSGSVHDEEGDIIKRGRWW